MIMFRLGLIYHVQIDFQPKPDCRELSQPAQLIVALPQHPQYSQEQVENVKIKGDGGPDVLIVSKALDQVVGVINDVPREDDSTNGTINSISCRAKREEHLHKRTTSQSQINTWSILGMVLCNVEQTIIMG